MKIFVIKSKYDKVVILIIHLWLFEPLFAGKWAWPPHAPLMVLGLLTQPKSWSIRWTFQVDCYLEPPLKKLSSLLAYIIAVKKQRFFENSAILLTFDDFYNHNKISLRQLSKFLNSDWDSVIEFRTLSYNSKTSIFKYSFAFYEHNRFKGHMLEPQENI